MKRRIALVLVALVVALVLVAPGFASMPTPYAVQPPDGHSFSQVSVSSTPYAAHVGELVKVNTSTLNVEVDLPSSPLPGAMVAVGDDHSNASVHPIVVAGNGHTVDGFAKYVIDISDETEVFVYFSPPTNDWKRVAFPTTVADQTRGITYQVYRASDLENLISPALPSVPSFPLSEANGGFGASVASSIGVPVLDGGGTAPAFVAPGASGNVLTSNGATWESAALPSSGWTTSALACDLTQETTQNIGTDGNYTFCGITWSKQNSAGTATLTHGTGLVLSGTAFPSYPSPRTEPLLYSSITNLGLPTNFFASSKLRILVTGSISGTSQSGFWIGLDNNNGASGANLWSHTMQVGRGSNVGALALFNSTSVSGSNTSAVPSLTGVWMFELDKAWDGTALSTAYSLPTQASMAAAFSDANIAAGVPVRMLDATLNSYSTGTQATIPGQLGIVLAWDNTPVTITAIRVDYRP